MLDCRLSRGGGGKGGNKPSSPGPEKAPPVMGRMVVRPKGVAPMRMGAVVVRFALKRKVVWGAVEFAEAVESGEERAGRARERRGKRFMLGLLSKEGLWDL